MPKADALLLVGPTGSGKTPLGERIERRGLGGCRCVHFDFGAQLRRVPAAGAHGRLTDDDVAFVRSVLQTGALLEDEHFPIAERILRTFLAERSVGPGDLVVLNGLPRHAGQARDVERIVTVGRVIELACTTETILARIRTDAGGDRAGRVDDDAPAVRRKLALYAARTAPLLDHYHAAGVPVDRIVVTPAATADDVLRELGRVGA